MTVRECIRNSIRGSAFGVTKSLMGRRADGFTPPTSLTNMIQYFLDNNKTYFSSKIGDKYCLESLETHGTVREPRKGRLWNLDSASGVLTTDQLPASFTQFSMFLRGEFADTSWRTLIHGGGAGFNSSIWFVIQNATGALEFRDLSNIASSSLVPPSGIVDVGVTYNAGTVIFYMNDSTESNTVGDGTLTSAGDTQLFGVGTNYRSNGSCVRAAIGIDTWTSDEWTAWRNNLTIPDGAWAAYNCNEETGTTGYDRTGNGRSLSLSGITQSSFHATSTDVTDNPANTEGFNFLTTEGSAVVPRNDSDQTNDVLGNSLSKTENCPYPATVNTPCITSDGADPHISLPSTVTDTINVSKDFTFEITFKLTGTGTLRRLFTSNKSATEKFLVEYSADNHIRVIKYTGTWEAIRLSFSDTTDWHTLVCKQESGTLSAELDGDSFISSSVALTTPDTTDTAVIGADLDGGNNWLGQYCNIRIWNTAEDFSNLSDPDILYTCEEGPGLFDLTRTIHDSGPDKLHGELIGGTLSDVWAEQCPGKVKACCTTKGGTLSRNFVKYTEDITEWDGTGTATDIDEDTFQVTAANQFWSGYITVPSAKGKHFVGFANVTADVNCNIYIYSNGSTGMGNLFPTTTTAITAGVKTKLTAEATADDDAGFSNERIQYGLRVTSADSYPVNITIHDIQLELDEETEFQMNGEHPSVGSFIPGAISGNSDSFGNTKQYTSGGFIPYPKCELDYDPFSAPELSYLNLPKVIDFPHITLAGKTSSHFVDISADSSFELTDDFSVFVRVYIEATSSDFEGFVSMKSDPAYGWNIAKNSSNLIVCGIGDGSSNTYIYSNDEIAGGIWYDICLVYSSGEITLYIDAMAQDNTITKSIVYQTGAKDMALAKFYTVGTALYSNCRLADLQMIDKVLTQSEIEDLGRGTYSGGEHVIDMPLTDGEGLSTKDFANSNHGAITTATESEAWANTSIKLLEQRMNTFRGIKPYDTKFVAQQIRKYSKFVNLNEGVSASDINDLIDNLS